MIYICKKKHPLLTVGAKYTEQMPNPNSYNACVKNDLGGTVYIPRDEFFDVVSEDEHQENATSVTIGNLTLSGKAKDVREWQDHLFKLGKTDRDGRVGNLGITITEDLRERILTHAINSRISFNDAAVELIKKGLAG